MKKVFEFLKKHSKRIFDLKKKKNEVIKKSSNHMKMQNSAIFVEDKSLKINMLK